MCVYVCVSRRIHYFIVLSRSSDALETVAHMVPRFCFKTSFSSCSRFGSVDGLSAHRLKCLSFNSSLRLVPWLQAWFSAGHALKVANWCFSFPMMFLSQYLPLSSSLFEKINGKITSGLTLFISLLLLLFFFIFIMGRERQKHRCEKHQSVAFCTFNPGVFPGWEAEATFWYKGWG